MDRLTSMSITNCIKELGALEQLVSSGHFSYEVIADWIAEVSWNLERIFHRSMYDSDEFRLILRKLIHDKKRGLLQDKQDEEKDDKV